MHHPDKLAAGFLQYQRQFASHLRAPKAHAPPPGVAAGRMRVYTELVFNTQESTLAACYPVCKKVLGQRRWRRLVRDFIAQHRATTPLFRQIPEEFLRFLEAQPQPLLPYLVSLAHYEWIELALSLVDVEEPPPLRGDLLSGVPLLAPALALLHYPYPVQRISPRWRPRRPSPVHLLVFRDRAGQVCFIELNALSAQLVDLLQAGELSGLQAIQRIADAAPTGMRAGVQRHGCALLAELHQLGAIVGAQPPVA